MVTSSPTRFGLPSASLLAPCLPGPPVLIQVSSYRSIIVTLLTYPQLAKYWLSRIRFFCWWQARWSPPLSSWWFWAPPCIWFESVSSNWLTLSVIIMTVTWLTGKMLRLQRRTRPGGRKSGNQGSSYQSNSRISTTKHSTSSVSVVASPYLYSSAFAALATQQQTRSRVKKRWFVSRWGQVGRGAELSFCEMMHLPTLHTSTYVLCFSVLRWLLSILNNLTKRRNGFINIL